MVALPPVWAVKLSGAPKSRFSTLPSSLSVGVGLPPMSTLVAGSSSKLPGRPWRKMRPKLAAELLTLLLNISTVLATLRSSLVTLWVARSSSMREVA